MSSPNPSDQTTSTALTISEDVSTEISKNVSEHPLFKLVDTMFPSVSFFFFILRKHLEKIPERYTRPVVGVLIVGYLLRFAQHAINEFLLEPIRNHFTSRADLSERDEIFNIVLTWMARQSFASSSRFFTVITDVYNSSYRRSKSMEDKNRLSKEDFKYSPAFGTYRFWHGGRLWFFTRKMEAAHSSGSEYERISISTLGRDPSIIKNFLRECKKSYIQEDAMTTQVIRSGKVKGQICWMKPPSTRTSRPFSTVVLDEQIKKSLIADMEEYLSPHQERWYANRGIPYRRGYLFYGPPGTGKSSISFALAGLFNIRIYVISLSSEMNDTALDDLFSLLPQKCIVLMEDIDSAGLTHQRTKSHSLVKENSNVSLSGLLNVLDGVTSQQGRILIMTTNHIEKLDAALIRPGRIDVKVKFGLASQAQLLQLFKATYERREGDLPTVAEKLVADYSSKSTSESPNASSVATASNAIAMIDQEQAAAITEATDASQRNKISELAEKFAAIVPSNKFSPAEIQGYLLRWKRDPEMAIEKATEWISKAKVSKAATAKAARAEKKAVMTELKTMVGKLRTVNEQISLVTTSRTNLSKESEIEKSKFDSMIDKIATLINEGGYPVSNDALDEIQTFLKTDGAKILDQDLISRIGALSFLSDFAIITEVMIEAKTILANELKRMTEEDSTSLEKCEVTLKNMQEERIQLKKKIVDMKEVIKKLGKGGGRVVVSEEENVGDNAVDEVVNVGGGVVYNEDIDADYIDDVRISDDDSEDMSEDDEEDSADGSW